MNELNATFDSISNSKVPLVSVVITARNEALVIENCLKSIFEQTYPNFEVVFVDDNSTDDTFQKAKKLLDYSKLFKNCKRYLPISIEANSPAKGRNAGVKITEGSIIAFTDADCIARKDWLENLIKCLPHEMGAVGGPNIIKHNVSSKILEAIDYVLKTYLGSGGAPQFLKIDKISEVYAVPACNLAMQKQLFNKLGGFNEELRYNEDSDLCRRIGELGFKIIYTPEAIVDHFMGLDSYQKFMKFIYKYGFERGKNSVTNHRLITKIQISSCIFIFTIFSFSILSLFFETALTPLLIIIAVILVVVLSYSIKISLEKRSAHLFFLIFYVFLSEYMSYNTGLLFGYLSGIASKKIQS